MQPLKINIKAIEKAKFMAQSTIFYTVDIFLSDTFDMKLDSNADNLHNEYDISCDYNCNDDNHNLINHHESLNGNEAN